MTLTRFGKITVLLNCLVPATLLGWDAYRGQLGANPVNFAIRTTGLLTLIFLLLTLAVTPLARLAHQGWLVGLRRMFGLCAFFHGLLHAFLFYDFDRAAKLGDTLSEIVKRPYLMVGTVAVVGMIPLAATSTDALIRRLGARRWKLLHRLTYVVAILGVVHFAMLVKADLTRPIVFGSILGALLGYRLVAHYVDLRTAYDRLRSTQPSTIPAALFSARPKFWSGRLKVARIFQETPEVRTFRLVATDSPRLPFDFLPGQYLNLTQEVDGRRVVRSYTIASPPSRVGYCEVTVKREGGGVSSRNLHDTVAEGSLLGVSAPAGRFTFTGSESGRLLLIAGGVGITPMMAKIRYLTDIGWDGSIHLIFVARTERDIIFRDELEYLRRRFANVRVTITLSGDDGSTWQGERGRITPELLARAVPDFRSHRVHVCGPPAMMDAVVAMLTGLEMPLDQIHLESFTRDTRPEDLPGPSSAVEVVAAGPLVEDGGVTSASVTFARSGRSKPASPDETVLEASEELGVDIPYDCRSGICGRCKVRLVSGHVVMAVQDALGLAERAGGMILGCQARCLDAVVVDA